jgi:hypothetical protein
MHISIYTWLPIRPMHTIILQKKDAQDNPLCRSSLKHMLSGLLQKRRAQMSNILQNTHANLTQVDYDCQM